MKAAEGRTVDGLTGHVDPIPVRVVDVQEATLDELPWNAFGVHRPYDSREGPGLDLDFEEIESLAFDIGQVVIQGTIEEILKIQFQRLGAQLVPTVNVAAPFLGIAGHVEKTLLRDIVGEALDRRRLAEGI